MMPHKIFGPNAPKSLQEIQERYHYLADHREDGLHLDRDLGVVEHDTSDWTAELRTEQLVLRFIQRVDLTDADSVKGVKRDIDLLKRDIQLIREVHDNPTLEKLEKFLDELPPLELGRFKAQLTVRAKRDTEIMSHLKELLEEVEGMAMNPEEHRPLTLDEMRAKFKSQFEKRSEAEMNMTWEEWEEWLLASEDPVNQSILQTYFFYSAVNARLEPADDRREEMMECLQDPRTAVDNETDLHELSAAGKIEYYNRIWSEFKHEEKRQEVLAKLAMDFDMDLTEGNWSVLIGIKDESWTLDRAIRWVRDNDIPLTLSRRGSVREYMWKMPGNVMGALWGGLAAAAGASSDVASATGNWIHRIVGYNKTIGQDSFRNIVGIDVIEALRPLYQQKLLDDEAQFGVAHKAGDVMLHYFNQSARILAGGSGSLEQLVNGKMGLVHEKGKRLKALQKELEVLEKHRDKVEIGTRAYNKRNERVLQKQKEISALKQEILDLELAITWYEKQQCCDVLTVLIDGRGFATRKLEELEKNPADNAAAITELKKQIEVLDKEFDRIHAELQRKESQERLLAQNKKLDLSSIHATVWNLVKGEAQSFLSNQPTASDLAARKKLADGGYSILGGLERGKEKITELIANKQGQGAPRNLPELIIFCENDVIPHILRYVMAHPEQGAKLVADLNQLKDICGDKSLAAQFDSRMHAQAYSTAFLRGMNAEAPHEMTAEELKEYHDIQALCDLMGYLTPAVAGVRGAAAGGDTLGGIVGAILPGQGIVRAVIGAVTYGAASKYVAYRVDRADQKSRELYVQVRAVLADGPKGYMDAQARLEAAKIAGDVTQSFIWGGSPVKALARAVGKTLKRLTVDRARAIFNSIKTSESNWDRAWKITTGVVLPTLGLAAGIGAIVLITIGTGGAALAAIPVLLAIAGIGFTSFGLTAQLCTMEASWQKVLQNDKRKEEEKELQQRRKMIEKKHKDELDKATRNLVELRHRLGQYDEAVRARIEAQRIAENDPNYDDVARQEMDKLKREELILVRQQLLTDAAKEWKRIEGKHEEGYSKKSIEKFERLARESREKMLQSGKEGPLKGLDSDTIGTIFAAMENSPVQGLRFKKAPPATQAA